MEGARDFSVASPVEKGISFYTNGIGIFFNDDFDRGNGGRV
jgi:hypothetical protein